MTNDEAIVSFEQAVHQADHESDNVLLQAALTQAGLVFKAQADLLAEATKTSDQLRDRLRDRTNQLADWQHRYAGVAEQLAQNFPPDAEVKRLKQWAVDLAIQLSAAQDEIKRLNGVVTDWEAKYRGGSRIAGSGLLETQPTSVRPEPES